MVPKTRNIHTFLYLNIMSIAIVYSFQIFENCDVPKLSVSLSLCPLSQGNPKSVQLQTDYR